MGDEGLARAPDTKVGRVWPASPRDESRDSVREAPLHARYARILLHFVDGRYIFPEYLVSLIVYNLFDIRGVATSCSSTRAEASSVWQLASTRRYLRSQAWQLSKLLAQICGHPKSERQHQNIATLGRWICWASEDVHDKRRSEAALSVCVDTIMQLTGPTPWRPLRLPYPPGEAEMKRPMRSERWARLWQTIRGYLLPLTPLLTAILALIAKR